MNWNPKFISCCFFWLFLSVSTVFADDSVRTWTTQKGGSLEASWDVESDQGGNEITLNKDGNIYKIAIDKLIQEDQNYIAAERAKKAQSLLSPEEPSEFELIAETGGQLGEGTQAGERRVVTIKGVEFPFRWCPAGKFKMGSLPSEKDREENETRHEVTLSHGFWMLETEVTQEMYYAVIGENPSYFSPDGGGADRLEAGTDTSKMPVESVSWQDAKDFCDAFNRLSGQERKSSLPTEAQWEYACRAGTTGRFAGTGVLSDMGWCFDDGSRSPHSVGQKEANAWGLYDMHGNVWEWCEDWYGDYPSGSVTDPTGLENGSYRVNRGGSWINYAKYCRSAIRCINSPTHCDYCVGFRLALVP